MKTSVTLFFMWVVATGMAQGAKITEDYVLPNALQRTMVSQVNGVNYKLYISLPQGFDRATGQQYPVLYLLDADYSFAIAKNIVDHLSERNHLKKVMVVGIAYAGPLQYRRNRTRDYTPTHCVESVGFPEIQKKYSGGGENFRKFIQDELKPFMAREYGGNGFSALAGHSYGGLFASWIMTQYPGLFDGYIIVSPSLWYDDHLVLNTPWRSVLSKGDKIRVYCGVGNREVNTLWDMPGDLEDFVTKLKSEHLQCVDLKYQVHWDETHNSIFPSALSNGIRHVFEGQ